MKQIEEFYILTTNERFLAPCSDAPIGRYHDGLKAVGGDRAFYEAVKAAGFPVTYNREEAMKWAYAHGLWGLAPYPSFLVETWYYQGRNTEKGVEYLKKILQ